MRIAGHVWQREAVVGCGPRGVHAWGRDMAYASIRTNGPSDVAGTFISILRSRIRVSHGTPSPPHLARADLNAAARLNHMRHRR